MNKTDNRIKGLMGLCMKAGKSGSGEFQCEEAIRRGRARLVLLAADASENTRKRFRDRCRFYHVPVIELEWNKSELGQAMGQGERSCVAICEEGLARLIQTAWEGKVNEVNTEWQK
jgi:ribosomal protein L7Ae-like RNA K-turn-binding protein